MLSEQRLCEYGGLLAAGYSLYQAKQLHDKELDRSRQRHQESVALAKQQHEADLKIVKQTYLLQLFNSLEQHFQQLNADLIASSRESERDMFDQRNQSFQTIILASSVMFSALTNLIVQGNVPTTSGQFIYVAYSLTSALSFAFLFLSMVFCIELVIRTSSFMYKRGKIHTRSLTLAIRDTKGMMKDLRGENVSIAKGTSGIGSRELSNDHSFSNSDKTIRRAISQMGPNEIEAEFDRHEMQVRAYLKKRELLNDSTAATSSASNEQSVSAKRAFKHFWEESCEPWWNLSILLFYLGGVNMLLALMIFVWAHFFIYYSSLLAAVIGISLIGIAIVIGYAVVLYMRAVDRNTSRHEVVELNQYNKTLLASPSVRSFYNTNNGNESNNTNNGGNLNRVYINERNLDNTESISISEGSNNSIGNVNSSSLVLPPPSVRTTQQQQQPLQQQQLQSSWRRSDATYLTPINSNNISNQSSSVSAAGTSATAPIPPPPFTATTTTSDKFVNTSNMAPPFPPRRRFLPPYLSTVAMKEKRRQKQQQQQQQQQDSSSYQQHLHLRQQRLQYNGTTTTVNVKHLANNNTTASNNNNISLQQRFSAVTYGSNTPNNGLLNNGIQRYLNNNINNRSSRDDDDSGGAAITF